MDLFLGIDGGQTGTRAALATAQGEVLAQASAGPWELLQDPAAQQRCFGHLQTLLTELSTHQSLYRISRVVLGLTGAINGQALVLDWMHQLLPNSRALVVHDSRSNYAGANPSMGPGAVVIAGGGSIAWGFNAQGEDRFVGGLGYMLGDDGSGYEMSRQAIRAALWAWQGLGPQTALTAALLEALHLSDPWEMRMAFYRMNTGQVARLLPVLAQLAPTDAVASSILQYGGRSLATLGATLLSQLKLFQGPIFPTGGAFRVPQVMQSFEEDLKQRLPTVQLGKPLLNPLGGCVALAIDAPTNPTVQQNLSAVLGAQS